ncbi:hypothetical protein Droror1_Dr00004474 [Drosera rotundifolia]
MDENSRDDVRWLNSLSESELEFLVTMKKLVFRRAIAIGHEECANKFDLKMLRTLGSAVMQHVKDKVLVLSNPGLPVSAAVFEGCNLLRRDSKQNAVSQKILFCVDSVIREHSSELDLKDTAVSQEKSSYIKSAIQQLSVGQASAVATNKRKGKKSNGSQGESAGSLVAMT